MLEGAVRCGPVPVLDVGGNVHHVPGVKLLGRLSPCLVVAPASGDQQDLSAPLAGLVDVPVVPAAWGEGYVAHGHLIQAQHMQVAGAVKVRGVGGILLPHGKETVLYQAL